MLHVLFESGVGDVVRWATCSPFFTFSALRFSWSVSGFLGLVSGWSWLEDVASSGFHGMTWAGNLNVDQWLFGMLGLSFCSGPVGVFGIVFSCRFFARVAFRG